MWLPGSFFLFILCTLCCCCSVIKSCPVLHDPMDCSTPGFPVLHHLLELVQIHVHRVSDAIQPSHPLLPPSPPSLNLSQHQGLSQWVGCSNQVAKVLELQLQSCQWMCYAVLSHSVMSNSLRPPGLWPARLPWPWGFSRQEYWSGLPCLPSGDIPNPGIEPKSPALQADFLPPELPGKNFQWIFRVDFL